MARSSGERPLAPRPADAPHDARDREKTGKSEDQSGSDTREAPEGRDSPPSDAERDPNDPWLGGG